MNKLVTILTPCYNGEKYIDRYVKSLLAQNYHNCQLVFMDDGSTDNTKEKILSYDSILRDNGIYLEYRYHENVGVGCIIAIGIKYVKGEYLVWPDIDDEMLPNSIIKKMDFLENNPDFSVVRTSFMTSQDSIDNIINFNSTKAYRQKKKHHLFEDYIVSKNMWLQPGCYMIRMSDFDKSNPDRYIFPTTVGQNWQMLLPVLYNNKCGFIDEPLYNYLIRSNSISHSCNNSFEKRKKKLELQETVIVETIRHMNIQTTKKNKYIFDVNICFLKKRVDLGFCFYNYNWAKQNWECIPTKNKDIKTFFKLFLSNDNSLNRFIRKIIKK